MANAWDWMANKGTGQVKKSVDRADRAMKVKDVMQQLKSAWQSMTKSPTESYVDEVRNSKNDEEVLRK